MKTTCKKFKQVEKVQWIPHPLWSPFKAIAALPCQGGGTSSAPSLSNFRAIAAWLIHGGPACVWAARPFTRGPESTLRLSTGCDCRCQDWVSARYVGALHHWLVLLNDVWWVH